MVYAQLGLYDSSRACIIIANLCISVNFLPISVKVFESKNIQNTKRNATVRVNLQKKKWTKLRDIFSCNILDPVQAGFQSQRTLQVMEYLSLHKLTWNGEIMIVCIQTIIKKIRLLYKATETLEYKSRYI